MVECHQRARGPRCDVSACRAVMGPAGASETGTGQGKRLRVGANESTTGYGVSSGPGCAPTEVLWVERAILLESIVLLLLENKIRTSNRQHTQNKKKEPSRFVR